MFTTSIAVVGAGHAGVEAALASARLGIDTTLFTLSLDSVANMPCNPSIGGTAKGHLVYEIDALGGEMGKAADDVTLQSRTLNLGKGAAVHSKRIQADRAFYHIRMKKTLESTPNLHLVQTEIVDLRFGNDPATGKRRVEGVVTKLGEEYQVKAVILCTGTYLDGRIFVGDRNYSGGPDGYPPAIGLSDSLRREGVHLLRFKTGTPARIKRDSIDFSVLEEQPGEDDALPYSADSPEDRFAGMEQIPCHIVYTNENTHTVIRENLHRSAMYSGQIHGTGPRYCPSIEDKLVRFADKERHQLFVEPLGRDTEEMYLQGFSTSMPTDVQRKMVASLKGFEHAEIMRFAYAIEYDCVDPLELDFTLGFKNIEGLYGAGQFNGTSGYEEAAAQGLVAGINAALWIKGEEPMILKRSDGYIGTLIDDLVIKGTKEPYRMMTSRSEYRLLLRQDNADERLTPIGHRVGLVDDGHFARFEAKKAEKEREIGRLEKTYLSPTAVAGFMEAHGMPPATGGISLADLLRRPGVDYGSLAEIDPDRPTLSRRVRESVEISVKYDGYIKRQIAEVGRRQKLEEKKIPEDMDYSAIRGLRIEAAQKLAKYRPATVGQASRISGVSPADISVLLIAMGK